MIAIQRFSISRQRRSYTPKLKREATSLVLVQDYSCIEAARSLGSVRKVAERRSGEAKKAEEAEFTSGK